MKPLRSIVTAALVVAPLAVPATLFAQGATTPAASASTSAVTVASPPPSTKKINAKIAFIDIERCLYESEDGLRAKAALAKFSDRRRRYVAEVELRLKDQEEELRALFAADDPTAQNKALLLQHDAQAYNDLVKRVNAEIGQRDDELFTPIDHKLHGIIIRIGESEGYDVIIDKKALPFGPKPVDLTERVIHEYNWGLPKPAASGSAAPVESGSATPPKPSTPASPSLPAF